MRRVRKDFRKDVLKSISAGDGSIEKLTLLAGEHFGHQVGYELLIRSFLGTEVSNAVSCLRAENRVESIGKQWKTSEELEPEDIDIISIRRLKRLRGELRSTIQIANQHGRFDEAVSAAKMLGLIESELQVKEEVTRPQLAY
jgi:hypothetical protein